MLAAQMVRALFFLFFRPSRGGKQESFELESSMLTYASGCFNQSGELDPFKLVFNMLSSKACLGNTLEFCTRASVAFAVCRDTGGESPSAE
mmetsp:Transcript_78344/g.187842  ORF Transcript_78344/g.187842 Transcript_78344/m.187842 type:complete len:91 (-) Transcript_78344:74-346(-)